MPNSELLSDFIDLVSLNEQKVKLQESFNEMSKNMSELQIQAQGIFKGFGDVSDLKRLVDLTGQSANANGSVKESLQKMAIILKDVNDLQVKSNSTIQERINLLKTQAIAEMAPANSMMRYRAEIDLLKASLKGLNEEKQKQAFLDIKNGIAQKESMIAQIPVGSATPKNITANGLGMAQSKGDILETQAAMAALNERLAAGRIAQSDYNVQMGQLNERLSVSKIELQEYTAAVNAEIKADDLSSSVKRQITADTIENRIAVQQANAELKKKIMLAIEDQGSVKAARAEIALLNLEQEKLVVTRRGNVAISDEEIAANIARRDSIIAEKDALHGFIAENADANLKRILNIGKYSEGVTAGIANSDIPKMSAQLDEINAKLAEMDALGQQGTIIYQGMSEEAAKLRDNINSANATPTGTGGVVSPTITNASANSFQTLSQQINTTRIAMEKQAIATGMDSAEFIELSNTMKALKATQQEMNIASNNTVTLLERIGQRLETMGLRMFIHIAIIGVLIEAYQKVYEFLTHTDKASLDAKDSLDKYTQSMKDLYMAVDINLEKENTKTKQLLSDIQDVGLAYEFRVKSMNDLIALYPGLLSDMEREAFLSGDLSGNLGKINKVQAMQAQVDYLQKTIDEKQKRVDDMEKPMESDLNKTGEHDILGRDTDVKKKEDEIKELVKTIADYKDTMEDFRKQINYILNPPHEGRILIDIQNDIQEAERKRDNNPDGTDMHSKALADIKKLEIERANFMGAQKDNSLKDEKALTDEYLKQYQIRVKGDSDLQKEISDNENESYLNRLSALKIFYELQKEMKLSQISQDYTNAETSFNAPQKKGESDKDYSSQKKLSLLKMKTAEMQYNAEIMNADKILNDGRKKLGDDYIQHQLDSFQILDKTLENNKANEVNNENIRYNKGLESKENYDKNIQKIDEKYTRGTLEMKLALLKEFQKDAKNQGLDTTKIDSQVQETQNKVNTLPKTNAPSSNPVGKLMGMDQSDWDDLNQKTQEYTDKSIEMQNEISKAVDQRYNQEIEAIQVRQKFVDMAYDSEINNINGSMMSEQRKAAAIKVLNAQKMESDLAAHNAELQLKRKMAADDKVNNITQAIGKGALAVISALSVGPPMGYILAAITAAMVAVEVAEITSAPLPQYGTGTDDHPGGYAIIGELNKKETIYEPGKKPYSVSEKTVKNLPKHTRVIPEEDLVNGSQNIGTGDMELQMWGLNLNFERGMSELKNGLASKLDELNETIKNKKETHIQMTEHGWQKTVKNGQAWTTYLSKNFS